MRAGFARLDARSQRQLVGAVAALLLALAGGLSWQLHEARRAAEAALDASLRDISAMDTLLERYTALQQERGAGTAPVAEDIAAVVSRTLQGRSFQPTRIQQASAGELQVRLDEVAFADALAWLNDLEHTPGLVVGAVTVSQGPAGRASLTLVLRGG